MNARWMSRPASRGRVVIVLCGACACTSVTFAADIHIPADQPTIQRGIDAAVDGDRVLVAPGIYLETIDFEGKNLQVIGTGGARRTTIDARQAGSVVTFAGAETRAASLSGFTLQNGLRQGEGFYNSGGGVFIMNSSPTIFDNVIRWNRAYVGAGVVVHEGEPHLHHNLIVRNHLAEGIVLEQVGRALVDANRIEDNDGDGINVAGSSNAIVSRNVVHHNRVGISTNSGRVRIVDNLVIGNRQAGVTAAVGPGGHPEFVNNTVADNQLGEFQVRLDARAKIGVANNIFRTSSGNASVGCQQESWPHGFEHEVAVR